MVWTVYLSGEIHTDWRDQIRDGCAAAGLNVQFVSAVTDHEASDAAGDHLGEQSNGYIRDNQSAKVNSIRTTHLIKRADIAVIRFGEKYRQWNAAFDAGYCAAVGTPFITLHDESLVHPLKEVDAAAKAWAQKPEQVVQTLSYVLQGL